MSRSQTSPVHLQAAQRRMEALQLRSEGLTLTEIGDKLGISAERVRQIIKEELERLAEATKELVAAIRDQRLREIADYITQLRPTALKGDHKAIETTLKLMDREARFLGADAPAASKVEVKNTGNRYSEMSLEELREEARRQGIRVEADDAENRA